MPGDVVEDPRHVRRDPDPRIPLLARPVDRLEPPPPRRLRVEGARGEIRLRRGLDRQPPLLERASDRDAPRGKRSKDHRRLVPVREIEDLLAAREPVADETGEHGVSLFVRSVPKKDVVSGTQRAGVHSVPRDTPPASELLVSDGYSHSTVAGGFDVMSYATRLIPGTSLTIRAEIRSRSACGSRAQSAVIPSSLVIARTPTRYP